MATHNCHYVGPVAQGSPVCRNPATKAIMAVSETQGKRLQAYVCDEHTETEKAYFERIGHNQVTIEPIRS